MEPVGLFQTEGILFTLKDVTFSPVAAQMNEPFTVKGNVNLLKIPFMGPIWVLATVTYPEEWWEELIPIWGSPRVSATDIALGGDFTVEFPKGFEREGEFQLDVRVYLGPTYALDSIVVPPAPAVASYTTTFIVAGEAPPQEEQFRNFNIVSYSKNGGTPVTAPGVLELEVGDRCRVNFSLDHKGPSVTGKIYSAIWARGVIDPHDEILHSETSLAVPQSADWQTYEKSLDIIITSAISPGSGYGLYGKIIGITGGDVFTPYLESVITIKGVGAPAFTDLQITSYDTPVEVGGRCKVAVVFNYQGPAITKTLYAAIGNQHVYFDEILHGSRSISVPASDTPQAFQSEVEIPVTSAIDPGGSPYDLYAKIDGAIPDIMSPVLTNVITVTGAPTTPEFSDLQIMSYDSQVEAGDRCRVNVRFTYKGPAISKTLYAAIGNQHVYFDEILHGSRTISVPRSDNPQAYDSYVEISITSAIDPGGSPYDLYAKIDGAIPDISSPVLNNVITVTGAPTTPEFSTLSITSYDSPVEIGSRCRVNVRFTYQGPAITKTLYAAIGNQHVYFDEILHGSRSISIPRSDSPQMYDSWVEISITSAISPEDSPYDLYAKIDGAIPDISSPVLSNVITVTGAPSGPQFRNIEIAYIDSPVSIGDECQVWVRFEYRSPNYVNKALYAAIGNDGFFGFDEILHASKVYNLYPYSDWTLAAGYVGIRITSAISPGGSPYDVYAKITGPGNDLITPTSEDAVVVRS